MGNLHIVTGYKKEAHVTAADHGALNSAIFGTGEYVLGKGNKLSASVISNNQIRINDGDIMIQGRHVRLNEGTYVDIAVENGTQGMMRNDLIVARYTKDSISGTEDCNLVIIKGTAVASNPSDPEHISGSILEDHDLQHDMLLYRVPLVGLNVQALEPLFILSETTLQDLGAKQDGTNALKAETTIADVDYLPFYDTSASANRKTLWSNIVAKIRTALFGTANGVLKADGSGNISAATMDTTPTENSTNPVTSGGVKSYVDANGAVAVAVTVTGWDSGTKQATCTCSGVTASNNIIVTPAPASYLTWAECQVRAVAQDADSITFQCEEIPGSEITANVLIVG